MTKKPPKRLSENELKNQQMRSLWYNEETDQWEYIVESDTVATASDWLIAKEQVENDQ